MLLIATEKTHFQFKGNFFDQIDGVAMGSPLGPLFANVFMQDFETKHMQELESLGVNKWYRYVDDIFATVSVKDQASSILKFLNEQHKNIKFTIEYEKNNKLPFLDTNVIRKVNKYITTIFHKKTFTGVYLNWTSLTSRKYKIGLIKCLLDRIWRICSDENDRELEIRTLESILLKNQYPTNVIQVEFEKF